MSSDPCEDGKFKKKSMFYASRHIVYVVIVVTFVLDQAAPCCIYGDSSHICLDQVALNA